MIENMLAQQRYSKGNNYDEGLTSIYTIAISCK